MGKTNSGKQHGGRNTNKKIDHNESRTDESLTFSLRETVKDATAGKVFGPECVFCHEAIDTRSDRKNGNITQGWIHRDCTPWATQEMYLAVEAEEQVDETAALVAELEAANKK